MKYYNRDHKPYAVKVGDAVIFIDEEELRDYSLTHGIMEIPFRQVGVIEYSGESTALFEILPQYNINHLLEGRMGIPLESFKQQY